MNWEILEHPKDFETHLMKWQDTFVLRVTYFKHPDIILAEVLINVGDDQEKTLKSEKGFICMTDGRMWALEQIQYLLQEANEAFNDASSIIERPETMIGDAG